MLHKYNSQPTDYQWVFLLHRTRIPPLPPYNYATLTITILVYLNCLFNFALIVKINNSL